jgi:hypothetical protein
MFAVASKITSLLLPFSSHGVDGFAGVDTVEQLKISVAMPQLSGRVATREVRA